MTGKLQREVARRAWGAAGDRCLRSTALGRRLLGGASLLALLGKGMGTRGRSYSVAVAAGILLALTFGDLFPEALELGGRTAVGGFALFTLLSAYLEIG